MAFSKDALHLIPYKANKVLHAVLMLLILVAVKLWHLCVIQHQEKLKEAFHPRRKTLIESAERGTIRDRFNVPLAINKIHYRLSISYAQLREIPVVAYVKNESGKRVRRQPRREYIQKLSKIIAAELHQDPGRVEDLIHAYAPSHDHVPFVIHNGLSEQQYYRFRMLEKDYPGILAEKTYKRVYPKGKVACDVLGYLGPISRDKYNEIIHEIKELSLAIQEKDMGNNPDLPEWIGSWAEARIRLKELQERAYTLNDDVGKTGIESMLEEDLRGFYGKKIFFTDAQGNLLRQMHGSHASIPGKRILLSISSELQEFAESLLAESEKDRDGIRISDTTKGDAGIEPWIKGGSIVAINPKTGEVLALASSPRYDPNDFIRSRGGPAGSVAQDPQVTRWLEMDSYLAALWDQKRPLERETYHRQKEQFIEEQRFLTWRQFLKLAVRPNSPIHQLLAENTPLITIYRAQKEFESLLRKYPALTAQQLMDNLFNAPDHFPCISGKKETLSDIVIIEPSAYSTLKKFFKNMPENEEKLLALDLSRLIIDWKSLSEDVLLSLPSISLSQFRDLSASYVQVKDIALSMTKHLFKELHFCKWREENEKAFLKQCRDQERAQKRYAKPYLEYFDREESRQFKLFWQEYGPALMQLFLVSHWQEEFSTDPLWSSYVEHFTAWYQELSQGAHSQLPWVGAYCKVQEFLCRFSDQQISELIRSFKGFSDLDQPLWGRYRGLGLIGQNVLTKHLAASFKPAYSPGYTSSFAFRRASAQGSIFKLVTSYAALKQRFESFKGRLDQSSLADLLVLTDRFYRINGRPYVGSFADGKPIPQFYKGGRIPKSLSNNIGQIDFYRAIETSSNPYFALLAGDFLDSPNDLVYSAETFGYGEKTGIELPGESPGKVPHDVETNRSALYELSIGQHSLMVTPLQTAVALSAICNGGYVLQPSIIKLVVGYNSPFSSKSIPETLNFPYKEGLRSAGIDFPLFGAYTGYENSNQLTQFSSTIRRQIFMPKLISQTLLDSMYRVVAKIHHQGTTSLAKYIHDHPKEWARFQNLADKFVGKTSTSEVFERLGLGVSHTSPMYSHIWFGGISFDTAPLGEQAQFFLSKDRYSYPELVVVVFLRFAGYGKEAAPIAAQVVHKWREIQGKYEEESESLPQDPAF